MKMNSKLLSISFYLLTLQICYSFMYLPFQSPRQGPRIASSDNVGNPLILTPLLESRKFTEARQRSSVPQLIKGIVSHAGYFTVEPKYNSNLFFWFFKAKNSNWQKVPLLLWLQGGPGCSSIFGLFGENGPFFVAKNKLRQRKYAWTNQYNVVYIDQPVGTGYSFTNSTRGYINNQEMVADHLYKALTQFFQLFPELKTNKFYITGESYGGKYVPSIAYRIHKLKMAGKCDFNLKGLFIVSAFVDPINMMHYSDFGFKVGIIDLQTKINMSKLEKSVVSLIHSGLYAEADLKWNNALDLLSASYGGEGLYDYTRENFFGDERYLDYVQSSEIRKKIHVGNSTYEDCSKSVNREFTTDMMNSTKFMVEELLEYYPVAFAGGQLDVICAYPLVSRVLQKLQWSGAYEFSQAKRQFLYDGDRVTGYFKVAGNLKDISIRKAGHMIPSDQPKVALTVLQKFIDGKL